MVKYLDLQAANAKVQDELSSAAQRVIASGQYVFGPELESFENNFASYCKVRHCIGVASGLDALILLLRGLILQGKLQAGDQVLVPAFTYIASILALQHAGLQPVLIEPDEDSFNISPANAAAAATSKVRALMTVHLFGRTTAMGELEDLCSQHGWLLLADAAQAHGAQPPSGTLYGHAAGFSFYPTKNLGALGDGGAIVTDDDELAATARSLRHYGFQSKDYCQYLGYNSRLDPLQAAFLNIKLPHLDEANRQRRAVALRYLAGIRNHSIKLPTNPANPHEHVWHQFVIKCATRDKLRAHLQQQGIETMIHYPIAPHQQQVFAATDLARYQLPICERLSRQVLSLPIGSTLSEATVDEVIGALNCYPG